MTAKQLAEMIKEEIGNYIDLGAYGVGEVTIHEVMKNNEKLTGIAFKPKTNDIAPSIYADYFVDSFENSEKGKQELFEKIQNILMDSFNIKENQVLFSGISNVAEECFTQEYFEKNLRLCVMSTETNKDYLSEIPHKNFSDMSLYYKIMVGKEASITVRNEHLKYVGIDERQLHALAVKSQKENVSYEVRDMKEIIKGIFEKKGFEVDEYFIETIPSNLKVISNKEMLFGAACIYDDDLMSKAVKDMGENQAFVLPSSVHEIILAPYNEAEIERFHQMVCDVNATEVAPMDRLTDNVYMYDANRKELTQLTGLNNSNTLKNKNSHSM